MPHDQEHGTMARGCVRRLDALVVGQGFGGMYMLHRARGMGLDVLAIEVGDWTSRASGSA